MLLYLPTLNGDFVYDDRAQLLIEGYVSGPEHFPEVLTLRVLGRDVIDAARPVHLLSLMLDARLWGASPPGYHLTNVLLHGACTALVFLFLLHVLRLSPRAQPTPALVAALGGALLFAAHPVQSEAVCVITFREDLLVTLFILLGLLLASRLPAAKGVARWLHGLGCVICLAAGAAAKDHGVVGPPLLLAYGLLFHRRERAGAWGVVTACSFLAVAALQLARYLLKPEHSDIFNRPPDYLGGSFAQALLTQPRLALHQLGSILWPFRLCADYGPYNLADLGAAASWLALACVLLGWAVLARRRPVVALAGGFYGLGLLPTSNLVPLYCPLADRYLYLPLVGIALLLAGLGCEAMTSRRRAMLFAGLVLALVLVWIPVTRARQAVWADEARLWRDTLDANPYSHRAANSGGFVLLERGHPREALALWQRAIELSHGQEADDWAGLAVGLDALGRRTEAEEALVRALALDRRYSTPAALVRACRWTEPQALRLQRLLERPAGNDAAR